MANDDWDVTKPVNHTLFGDGPSAIRDVVSSTKIIIAKEHVMPSTDNAGGQHVKGSSRVYLDTTVPTTDPEGNSLDTSATSDNGRIAVLTGSSNIMKVYANTSAGVTTGFQHIAAGRVYLADTMNANSLPIIGLPLGTVSGNPIHVGQFDTTYFELITPATSAALQPKLKINSLSTGLATSGQALYVAMTPAAYTTGDSITLPNGLILKFGSAALSSYAATIAFTAAFPNALLAVSVTPVSSTGNRTANVDDDPAAAATGFTIISNGATGTVYWMAIGY